MELGYPWYQVLPSPWWQATKLPVLGDLSTRVPKGEKEEAKVLYLPSSEYQLKGRQKSALLHNLTQQTTNLDINTFTSLLSTALGCDAVHDCIQQISVDDQQAFTVCEKNHLGDGLLLSGILGGCIRLGPGKNTPRKAYLAIELFPTFSKLGSIVGYYLRHDTSFDIKHWAIPVHLFRVCPLPTSSTPLILGDVILPPSISTAPPASTTTSPALFSDPPLPLKSTAPPASTVASPISLAAKPPPPPPGVQPLPSPSLDPLPPKKHKIEETPLASKTQLESTKSPQLTASASTVLTSSQTSYCGQINDYKQAGANFNFLQEGQDTASGSGEISFQLFDKMTLEEMLEVGPRGG
ncbi:hypothetical protein B0H14DRAFT_2659260 [Mycena olivaceomarginata]|nr:hypothetical protein B0H14DRAFT_2659260 [Mycena olivaceomarginata]